MMFGPQVRPSTRTVCVVRWMARLLATGMFLLITLIACGEGPPNPWRQPWQVNLELHLFGATWLGYLLGWRWEGLGGGLITLAMVSFLCLERHPPDLTGTLLLLPGPGYLFCWAADRFHRTRAGAAQPPDDGGLHRQQPS